MARLRTIGIALALGLAGTSAVAAPPANPFSDKLAKLSELQRLGVMRRAVLDSGERCKRVTDARLQGRYGNLMMWTARCTPGGDYGVFIGPDGSVQTRSCADLVALKLPQCRMPPSPKK